MAKKLEQELLEPADGSAKPNPIDVTGFTPVTAKAGGSLIQSGMTKEQGRAAPWEWLFFRAALGHASGRRLRRGPAQAAAMSMPIAMLFLVESTAACGPAAPARLGGGAEVVRAVLDFEEEESEPSVPTPAGLSRSIGAAPRVAEPGSEVRDFDAAPAQCKPSLVPIA